MKKIFVSILIANYNKKKYISRCLKSLENQTYKNFEVIFFDDKSTDNSVQQVKKFFNKLNIFSNKFLIYFFKDNFHGTIVKFPFFFVEKGQSNVSEIGLYFFFIFTTKWF